MANFLLEIHHYLSRKRESSRIPWFVLPKTPLPKVSSKLRCRYLQKQCCLLLLSYMLINVPFMCVLADTSITNAEIQHLQAQLLLKAGERGQLIDFRVLHNLSHYEAIKFCLRNLTNINVASDMKSGLLSSVRVTFPHLSEDERRSVQEETVAVLLGALRNEKSDELTIEAAGSACECMRDDRLREALLLRVKTASYALPGLFDGLGVNGISEDVKLILAKTFLANERLIVSKGVRAIVSIMLREKQYDLNSVLGEESNDIEKGQNGKQWKRTIQEILSLREAERMIWNQNEKTRLSGFTKLKNILGDVQELDSAQSRASSSKWLPDLIAREERKRIEHLQVEIESYNSSGK
jgi:hypothetical protein